MTVSRDTVATLAFLLEQKYLKVLENVSKSHQILLVDNCHQHAVTIVRGLYYCISLCALRTTSGQFAFPFIIFVTAVSLEFLGNMSCCKVNIIRMKHCSHA